MIANTQMVIVDSSVAFKWFVSDDEERVEEARSLLQAHANAKIVLAAPGHLPVELMNSLRYSNRSGDLHVAAKWLDLAGLLIVPTDAQLLCASIDIARAYDLTIYDAFFPALAMHFDCELVTADRKQARVTECPVRLLA